MTSTRPRLTLMEILFLLFPLIFAALGVALILTGTTTYRKTKLAESWPRASGTIRASRVRSFEDEGATKFAPQIEYTYTIDGRQYESSGISPEIFVHFSDAEEAKRFVAKYPPGGEARVFYNPEDPEESALETKAAPVLHFVTFMGVASCLFTLAIYYSYYRGYRASRRA